jgi:hypothetical protein
VISKCYQSVIKVLSKCCQSFVKVLSKCCQSVVKVLSKCCQSVVKVLLKCCCSAEAMAPGASTHHHQPINPSDTKVSAACNQCKHSVIKVFQECYKSVMNHRLFGGLCCLHHEVEKLANRLLAPRCHLTKRVTRVLQECDCNLRKGSYSSDKCKGSQAWQESQM